MLEPPDTHVLLAATGWLELGNAAEAEAELVQLSPEASQHPDVLELRWLVFAKQAKWGEGLQVAQKLMTVAPERPTGWLHRAYALRRLPNGSLQEAWKALLPAHRKFPRESLIPYNLSCYACQMGDLDEARQWLQLAVKCEGLDAIKKLALADEDLVPLWDEIQRMA
jgi:predicted Zn-dependent protease